MPGNEARLTIALANTRVDEPVFDDAQAPLVCSPYEPTVSQERPYR